MNFFNFRSCILSLALLIVFVDVDAQYKKGDFFGNISIASNFCQIDGDQASGFNKFGFSAGYIVGQVLKEANQGYWVYSTGASFSVRGSRRPFNPDFPSNYSFHFVYQMIDIPLFINRYYKNFSGGAGLRTTYLLDAKDLDGFVLNLKSNMRDVNILGCVLTDYKLSDYLRLMLEYQYSLNSIRKGDANSTLIFPTGVYHHVISLGLNINFSGQ